MIKRRVAIVRQTYRDDGGAERFVSRLLSAFGTSAIDITLIARHWHDGGQAGNDLRFFRCNPPHFGRLSRDWRFAKAVQQVIRQSSYDLVQTNERIPGCDVYRAGDGVHREWLSQKSRLQHPLGRLYSAVSPYHLYLKYAEKKLFKHPRLRAVICNSKMVKAEISRNFNVDDSKVHVIYNGVDTSHFHPSVKAHRLLVRTKLGIDDRAPVFLFVGSGFARKGLGKAIEAISRVKEAHLIVVGNTRRNGKYLAVAANRHCSDRVHFIGVVSDVRPYYGMADAFVLPAVYDPFPNAILEAMACGLAVITSTHCGATDIISQGRNGFICDAFDELAIAEAMTKLSNQEVAGCCGAEARAAVEPYTIDRMQQELTDLYQELMESARG